MCEISNLKTTNYLRWLKALKVTSINIQPGRSIGLKPPIFSTPVMLGGKINMSKRASHLIAYIFILITSMAYGDEDLSRVLFPVEVDGKYGYIDKTGQIVIAPKFDDASPFSEGMARILVGDHESGAFGYIDTTGKIVIKARFKGAGLFNEGVAIARDNKGLGAIDKNGRFILRLKSAKQDAHVEGFREGLTAVGLNWKESYGFYYGFIDLNGKVVIPAKYHDAKNFSEGLAAVQVYGAGDTRFGLYGFIDKKDKLVIDPIFKRAWSFHQGLAAVSTEKKKCGYIDKKGGWVVPAFFERCGDFSEGIASIEIDGKYGYINKKGEVVIAPQFSDARGFSGGLALVEKSGKDENTIMRGYINTRGSFVWGPKSYSTLP